LQDELDVVSVIKTIRAFALVNKILFSPEQRLLLKFQNKDIMGSTSEDSDEGTSYQNIVYNLHSKNNDIREKFNGRFRDLMEKYEKKELDRIDRVIIKGLVQAEFHKQDKSMEVDDELSDLDLDRTPDDDGLGNYECNQIHDHDITNKSMSDDINNKKATKIAHEITDENEVIIKSPIAGDLKLPYLTFKQVDGNPILFERSRFSV